MDRFRSECTSRLDAALARIDSYKPEADHLKGKWNVCVWPTCDRAVHEPDTGIELDVVKMIGESSVNVPDQFVSLLFGSQTSNDNRH